MNITTLSVLFFLAGFLLVLGIQQLFSPKGPSVTKRVKSIKENEAISTIHKPEEKGDLPRKLLAAFGNFRLFNRMGRGMDKQLEESDVPLSGGEFMVLSLASTLAMLLLFFSMTMNLWAGILAGAITLYIPFLLVKRSRQKRLTSFNVQICDALSVMSNSMRAGFSFMQSVDMVCKEMPDPISKEFSRTFREVNLGASTERALQNLGKRVNSDDLDLVITAVLIQRQIGGNLAEVLDNIAETIRERVRIKGEIKTLTAQGRLSGIVIGLLPVFLTGAMLMINPSNLIKFAAHPVGRVMIFMAIGGEIIGFMCIKRIVDIKV